MARVFACVCVFVCVCVCVCVWCTRVCVISPGVHENTFSMSKRGGRIALWHVIVSIIHTWKNGRMLGKCVSAVAFEFGFDFENSWCVVLQYHDHKTKQKQNQAQRAKSAQYLRGEFTLEPQNRSDR